MHKISLFIFVVCSIVICAPCAIAENGAEKSKHIRIVTPPKGWPPFIINDQQSSNHSGIMTDVFNLISHRLGYQVSHDHYPEIRCQLNVRTGTSDVFYKAKEWVSDPENYTWTAPVLQSEDILISRAYDGFHFNKLADLTGKNIGIVFGFSYPALDDLFDKRVIRKHTTKDTSSLLRMVQRKHLDGAVTNKHVATWLIQNTPDLALSNFVFSSQTIGSAPYRFAFTKTRNWETFVKAFNQQLEAMRESGELESILQQYQ